MKRNLIILTIVGALFALAVPANSMAAKFGVFPAGHKFEIKGSTVGGPSGVPYLQGPMAGTCQFTKITGTVPSAPNNEATVVIGGEVVMPIAQPTLTCFSGLSATVAGEWSMRALPGSTVKTSIPAGGLTLRYTSLPGCKLVSTGTFVLGTWSNGISSPIPSHSGYSALAFGGGFGLNFKWQKDGTSTCALEGSTEELSYNSVGGPVGYGTAPVTDLTNPTENIIVAAGY
jgi:hypothetical protein